MLTSAPAEPAANVLEDAPTPHEAPAPGWFSGPAEPRGGRAKFDDDEDFEADDGEDEDFIEDDEEDDFFDDDEEDDGSESACWCAGCFSVLVDGNQFCGQLAVVW